MLLAGLDRIQPLRAAGHDPARDELHREDRRAGDGGAIADLRGGSGTGAVRLSAGPRCARCGQARASAAEHRSPRRGRRGLVGLFRPDPACGADRVHRAARVCWLIFRLCCLPLLPHGAEVAEALDQPWRAPNRTCSEKRGHRIQPLQSRSVNPRNGLPHGNPCEIRWSSTHSARCQHPDRLHETIDRHVELPWSCAEVVCKAGARMTRSVRARFEPADKAG